MITKIGKYGKTFFGYVVIWKKIKKTIEKKNSILLIQTSTDCGYFEDVLKAYHRLLDKKEKYIDIDVLKALSTSVEKNLKDPNGNSILKLRSKILELFGRITSLVL